jgi:hypothetical protein
VNAPTGYNRLAYECADPAVKNGLGGAMTKFEEMGRKLDQELERLREIAEKKISPATRDKAAKALRSVSAKLSRLAEELGSKSTPE